MKKKKANYLYGYLSEDKAAKFLEEKNYKILARNYRSFYGEIDIIAEKDNILHFVEVKASKKYQALYRINLKKLERISKTIEKYLSEVEVRDFQIDALIILNEEVEFIENISF